MPAFDPAQPWNELPSLPPAQELETHATLKAAITAHRALAALKEAGDLIPNQAMLINTIPLLEARSSSEIENILTTTDALFRELQLGETNTDPATKEALRYGTALWEGVESLKVRPVCTNTAIDICSTIKGSHMDIRRVPGTQLRNPVTEEVIYTPPEGQALLRDKLANWEAFLHAEDDVDPLIRMAVAHYQFEAIHPFTDGNGRTGRVLNLLYLVEKELLSIPVLYLSRYIIQYRADYYRLLREVTAQGNWEPWIVYMLTAVANTAMWTRSKISAVRDLLEHTATYVRACAPRIYSRELIDVVFAQPYCRIHNLVDAGIAKRQTASEYLKKLVDMGVLVEEKRGRDKLFVQPKLLELLTLDSHEFLPYAQAKSLLGVA
ncbi:MAG: Fic family protein [Pseudomonadales bacterium]|nr:Fic family protein [Pseudomonadales bacterium]